MEYPQFRTEDGRVAEGSGGCWNRPESARLFASFIFRKYRRRNKAYSALTSLAWPYDLAAARAWAPPASRRLCYL